MELKSIQALLDEINYLKNKGELLDEILRYYDKETMSFIVPEKWERLTHISEDALRKLPATPRHSLNKKIYQLLGYPESERLVNWDKMDETASSIKNKGK